MTRARKQKLQSVAEAVLDDRPIDWETEAKETPQLKTRLEILRQIHALKKAHRTIGGLASLPPVSLSNPARPHLFEWGPLQVFEKVGSGTFGEVYRALDTRLQREVALKLRRDEEASAGASRFVGEARGLARVRHPNVVAVYGIDVHDDRLGFWTEFIRGQTLEESLSRKGPLDAEAATIVGVILCQALAAVHEAGFVHGDVKAANVMRDEGGRIVLMDLGAFTQLGRSSGADGVPVFGTPLVTAPEVLGGEAPDVRSDVYSLGVLLYQLVSGHYPVRAESLAGLCEKIARGERTPLRDHRPDLPVDFVRAVERALEPEPSARYPSTGDMERALRASIPAVSMLPGEDGQTLRALVKELGRVPEEMCRFIGKEVARALTRIESSGGQARVSLGLDDVLLLGSGSVRFLGYVDSRDAVGSRGRVARDAAGPHEGTELIAPPAPLRQLGALLFELASGEPVGSASFSESLLGQTSPFFQEVVRWLLTEAGAETTSSVEDRGSVEAEDRASAVVNDRESVEAEDRGSAVGDRGSAAVQDGTTAAAVLQVLSDGEGSAWWRDRRRRKRRAERKALRRIRISRDTAMHGRDDALRHLREAYERAAAGDGRTVLLEGEAGIGKTRLVDELVGLLEREGEEPNFLFGSYLPGGAATAAGAFVTAYRDHFGEERLDEALQDYLAPAPLLVPPFAALLRGGNGGSDSGGLTKESLQTAFLHVTRSLAAERPTIVFIDDLHFAPAEGLSLFAALALTVPGHRILFLGGLRPDLPANWMAEIGRQEHCSRLALERLAPPDLVRILTEAFGSSRLAEELASELTTRSDGNPLFLFEHLRALEEARAVTRDRDGRWVVATPVRDLRTPSTIQHLIQSRFATLNDEDQELLDVASCLGFEFDPALVGEVVGLGTLAALKRFALIEKRHRLVRAAGRQLVFDHHQVQQTLYDSLFEPLRERYHAALAVALEQREQALAKEPGDLDGAVAVALCEHYFRGRRGGEALRYLQRALDHLGTLRPAASLQLIERALAHPGLVAGKERIDLLGQLTRDLFLLGKRDEERAVLDEMLRLSDQLGQPAIRARSRRMLGFFHSRSGQGDEAQAILEEALALARECDDIAEESLVTQTLAALRLHQGRFEDAIAVYERVLELARRSGNRLFESQVIGSMGVASMGLRRLDEAKLRLEEALAIAREVGSRSTELIAVGNLGALSVTAERYDEALSFLQEHLRLSRQTGIRLGEMYATGNLGSLALNRGDIAQALDGAEQSLAIAREIGHRVREIETLEGIGRVYALLGRREDARAAFDRCVALCQEMKNARVQGQALSGLASLAEQDGDLARAERFYEQAEEAWSAIGETHDRAVLFLRRGCLFRRLSRPDEARSNLREAAVLGRHFQSSQMEVLALAHLAVLPGESAAEVEERFTVLEQRLPHTAKMEARFLLWQATGERTHLEAAHELFMAIRDHAPERDRETLVSNVRLHREIEEAWAASSA